MRAKGRFYRSRPARRSEGRLFATRGLAVAAPGRHLTESRPAATSYRRVAGGRVCRGRDYPSGHQRRVRRRLAEPHHQADRSVSAGRRGGYRGARLCRQARGSAEAAGGDREQGRCRHRDRGRGRRQFGPRRLHAVTGAGWPAHHPAAPQQGNFLRPVQELRAGVQPGDGALRAGGKPGHTGIDRQGRSRASSPTRHAGRARCAISAASCSKPRPAPICCTSRSRAAPRR